MCAGRRSVVAGHIVVMGKLTRWKPREAFRMVLSRNDSVVSLAIYPERMRLPALQCGSVRMKR